MSDLPHVVSLEMAWRLWGTQLGQNDVQGVATTVVEPNGGVSGLDARNNYSNENARAYGWLENAGRLPVDPVIAIDNNTLKRMQFSNRDLRYGVETFSGLP